MIRVNVNRSAFKRLRSDVDALIPSPRDMRGPVLIELGVIHRRQEKRIFATQGIAGGSGMWPALNPRYAKRKRAAVGNKKILQLTGKTFRAFTMPTASGYVQRVRRIGSSVYRFEFGARSDVAAAHYYGNPGLAPASTSRVFGGRAPRLPVRDMISKTPAQGAEFLAGLKAWWEKRARQVARGAFNLTRDR